MSKLYVVPNGKDSIEIPDSVIKIELDACADCTSLTEIHLNHKLPKDFSEELWYSNKSEVTIYVSKGSGEAYRNSGFYNGFKDIIEE